MAQIYFELVVHHRRSCNPENKQVIQVPIGLQAAVLALLTTAGYNADGNRIGTC